MSMSPLVFAILFALVCAGMFLLGLRAFRMAAPPSGATVEQVRRFGRLLMMAATAMLISANPSCRSEGVSLAT